MGNKFYIKTMIKEVIKFIYFLLVFFPLIGWSQNKQVPNSEKLDSNDKVIYFFNPNDFKCFDAATTVFENMPNRIFCEYIIDSIRLNHLSNKFVNAEESILWNKCQSNNIIRFAYFRSFAKGKILRVSKNQNQIILTEKTIDPTGKVLSSSFSEISKADYDSLIKIIDESMFYYIRSVEIVYPLVSAESAWLIETCIDNKYHLVYRISPNEWSLEGKMLHTIGNWFLSKIDYDINDATYEFELGNIIHEDVRPLTCKPMKINRDTIIIKPIK